MYKQVAAQRPSLRVVKKSPNLPGYLFVGLASGLANRLPLQQMTTLRRCSFALCPRERQASCHTTRIQHSTHFQRRRQLDSLEALRLPMKLMAGRWWHLGLCHHDSMSHQSDVLRTLQANGANVFPSWHSSTIAGRRQVEQSWLHCQSWRCSRRLLASARGISAPSRNPRAVARAPAAIPLRAPEGAQRRRLEERE